MTSKPRGSVTEAPSDGRERPRAGSRARDADGSRRPARPGDRREASRRGRSSPPRPRRRPRPDDVSTDRPGFAHGKCVGNETRQPRSSVRPASGPPRRERSWRGVRHRPRGRSCRARGAHGAGEVARTPRCSTSAPPPPDTSTHCVGTSWRTSPGKNADRRSAGGRPTYLSRAMPASGPRQCGGNPQGEVGSAAGERRSPGQESDPPWGDGAGVRPSRAPGLPP
jgi:hypothetical protein